MPPPEDVAGVQRLIGMSQYLAKFLQHLSDLTKPLRELTQQDRMGLGHTAGACAASTQAGCGQHTGVEILQPPRGGHPSVRCASQSGLGAAMLQNGQPVAYASRALTPRYTQIEKEMLAIVFACDHLEAYIYGRQEINIETDHQPLEMIVKKLLNSAPKCLQRMLHGSPRGHWH